MGDYLCWRCEDMSNDCPYCSPSFERDKVHSVCGYKWGDHMSAFVQIDDVGRDRWGKVVYTPPGTNCWLRRECMENTE